MTKEYSSEEVLKLYDAILNEKSTNNKSCEVESSSNFLQKAIENCNKFNKEFDRPSFDELA